MNQYENMTVEEKYADFLAVPITTNSPDKEWPQILLITSYPPRECGIATYSHDLVKALERKFGQSFKIKICPLETAAEQHIYDDDVIGALNTDDANAFGGLASYVKESEAIKMVVIQHEFGFFAQTEEAFIRFLESLTKHVIVAFHTVLPHPNKKVQMNVQRIGSVAGSLLVMTKASAIVLETDYRIAAEKITIIPHGTHLVSHVDKETLKNKYGLTGKKVLSTFGLLSSGKSIETTLQALPAIVKDHPDALFLIIGKTHPSVVKQEGELYRNKLLATIENLSLQSHVKFINQFLPLNELLEYLQLTDIYLFTSKDPNQAVSGTFSYAISAGCPIISTPIPHAKEVLKKDAGIIIQFSNYHQLARAVNSLLSDEGLRKKMGSNGLHKMAATAWENGAIAHALLFKKHWVDEVTLKFAIPPINLAHVKKMTTHFGMIQFARISQPDIESGYTLDDNARALVAMCQLFALEPSDECLQYMHIYFDFIKNCLQPDGKFLNYLDGMETFTAQNGETNLEDATGRAIWALGFLISNRDGLPNQLIADAQSLLQAALPMTVSFHSTRAMAFVIKGLYYRHKRDQFAQDVSMIKELANRLVQMYRHEEDGGWLWFESYLTYGNSILPESLLCAWLATGNAVYKEIAKTSFDFLLSKTFTGNSIKVISNKTWLYKSGDSVPKPIGGEQPIDVAYTVLALSKFHQVFADEGYRHKMTLAFNWFLGDNHLHQIIYNPCTGGCYDGLEELNVNLNQGAESTVSYLMARLTMEKMVRTEWEQQVFASNKEERQLVPAMANL